MMDALEMWTVYDHPADAPQWFVARKWLVTAPEPTPTDDMLRAHTLDALRDQIPPGLHCMPRQPGDDPVIVETWF